MQKSDCIIGVEHVSKFFGDKAVLNDVNLSVRKGEFVTILGPSGCGKTTLLRLIAGFQTASEGIITIAGKEITQTPPHKRPVNTVFQKYALFPHLNVFNRKEGEAGPQDGRDDRLRRSGCRFSLRRAAAACRDCPCHRERAGSASA